MENLISDVWQYAETKNKQLYNWMNRDNLGGFIVDDKVFWIELVCNSTMPNYIYKILKQYGNRRGLTYLYDLPDSEDC